MIKLVENELQISELERLIFSTSENYIFYCSLLGFINIDSLAETQLIRNVKIRLAAFEMNHAQHKEYTISELQELFIN